MTNSPFFINSIPNDCEIVFVSDFFADQLIGGAELTSQALIDSSNFKIHKVNSNLLTKEMINNARSKFWLFGNWSNANANLLIELVKIPELKYGILEYDYKYCKYRSPEKHLAAENIECNCGTQQIGKFVEFFYTNASFIWWMSIAQQQKTLKAIPALESVPQSVLSSVFDENFWIKIEKLKNTPKNDKWIILGSDSWIKGTDDAINYCAINGLKYEVVKGVSPDEFLNKLAGAEGFVYLPKGGDTCPRVVIEAKLLGCKLHLNSNVQHASEDWFNIDDLSLIKYYLYNAREQFWNTVSNLMTWQPSISGYTTVRNCIEMEYPWENTIQSMLGFCDEVVVLDGGSTDGTWERLLELAKNDERIVARQKVRDWTSKRFAVFDGQQKAEARKLCTKDFCWQMDSDEVLPESDWQKVKNMCLKFPKEVDLVCLPVVEFWGSLEKVRMDVNPWKWRLSRNKPVITHGMPKDKRLYDENGELYAAQGTDGCDYVSSIDGSIVPCANFYSQGAHNARIAALNGDLRAYTDYRTWFESAIQQLPSVRHYSWLNMERKIRNYRDFWQKFWESLYNIKHEDTAENNMFFDKPWSQVTEDEIKSLAIRISNETGGHIFHSKINLKRPTIWISGIK